MAGESVSFRITRTTEDLAQTVAALSQRLGAMQLQLEQFEGSPQEDPEELRRLDNVSALLADCRSLLEEPLELTPSAPPQWGDELTAESLAA